MIGNYFSMGIRGNTTTSLFCIREFLELLAMDCFINTFTTDTGAPEKNIPFLDEIDNKATVTTCWILNCYSYSPCSSEISKISEITIATDTTTSIGHTASRKVRREVGRSNRAIRGYYNMRLPNRNICVKRSLWYCNGCLIRFDRRTYYCKNKSHDCFA